jgi:Abortive infection alpha
MTSGEELELAKASIEQIGETGREMIRLASGSSALGEAGGLLADEFRFQRFRRQLRLVKKAEKLVDEAGLSACAVPLKTLAPLITWASLEDDEEMFSRWANMLASAGCVATIGFHVTYPDLLRQLEPFEALMIESLFTLEAEVTPPDRQIYKYKTGAWRTLDELMTSMNRPWVEINVCNLENLVRLGLCVVKNSERFMLSGHNFGVGGIDKAKRQDPHAPAVRLTALGLAFALVCQPPGRVS